VACHVKIEHTSVTVLNLGACRRGASASALTGNTLRMAQTFTAWDPLHTVRETWAVFLLSVDLWGKDGCVVLLAIPDYVVDTAYTLAGRTRLSLRWS